MAPIKKRTTARARAARAADPRGRYAPPSPTHKASEPAPEDAMEDVTTGDGDEFGFGAAFKLNKQDKRTIKHNNLMNKVRDAGIRKEGKKALKRRRPGKKLKGDIGGLADALPDVEDEEEEWEGVEDDTNEGAQAKAKRKRNVASESDGKMKMKSLKHRPGAMKRKRAMEGREVERFGKNLAQLVGAQQVQVQGADAGAVAQNTTADRWTALRAFIGSTMEKDKAFT